MQFPVTDVLPLIMVVALAAIFLKVTSKIIKLILAIAVICVIVLWAVPKFVLGT